MVSPMKKIAIVGSGLTGASAARSLIDAGCDVTVFEALPTSGGMTKCDRILGVIYEVNGPHLFHTQDEKIWELVSELCQWVDYRHRILADPFNISARSDTPLNLTENLFSWPLQVNELESLPQWSQIRNELSSRPREPSRNSFATFCIDLVGPTLFDLFIGPYTKKQWGMAPDEIGAEWAPKRIELRTNRNLESFKDPYQGWPVGGYENLIGPMLAGSKLLLSEKTSITSHDWQGFDGVVLTCALDEFMDFSFGRLPWRGTRFEHQFFDEVNGTLLQAAAMNYPSADVAFTRKTEPKWYSGESSVPGTVITTEYPGESDDRHYPIYDRAGVNRALSEKYKTLVETRMPTNVVMAGRLATYSYINMDQAIRQGINGAKALLRTF